MIADPFRFVRRLAVLTALVVILGGTVFLYRRSVVPGVLYYVAGVLLVVAVARPSLVEALWPGARWHRTAVTRGLLVVAFVAFLGGTLAVPRPPSPIAQTAATSATSDAEPVASSAVATPASVATPADNARPTAAVPTETPSTPPTVRPAPSVVIAGEGAARPVSTPPTSTPLPPAPSVPSPTSLPDREALMASIDEAWERADWLAAEAAILRALAAYPQDSDLQNKLFAARISRGDQLVEAGQPAEAVRVYASAHEVRQDPLVDARLARLTPTPVPRRSVAFTGLCQPTVIGLADWFVVQLGILNTGDAPLDGLRIKASGPWERISMASVEPVGMFRLEGSIVEPEFVTRQTIQPGQTVYVQAVAYADQSGQYLFSFRPTRLNNEWLLGQNGQVPLVGCGLAVVP